MKHFFFSVRLWNVQEKKNLVKYTGHAYTVWDVCVNGEDTYFVSASLDKTLRLWNTEYACPLRIYAGHNESVDVSSYFGSRVIRYLVCEIENENKL